MKVININKGSNEELAERSTLLKGYEIFVYLVREHAKSMDRSSAIVRAIDDCVRRNVLKDFLERNASEVCNMLFTKWDWDVAKEVWQEEARDEGVAKGIALAIIALIFFACSDSSPNGPSGSGNPSSSSNGTTGAGTQVYFVSEEAKQCDNNYESCILSALNVPYTGSGVIKDKDNLRIGTIESGKINLESPTPKKELLNEDGWYCPELMFYSSAGEPVGQLQLMNYDYVNKDRYYDYHAYYCYFSEDYKKEETHTSDNDSQLLTWVDDYDVKKGWNLIYKEYDVDNRGDKQVVVFTETNNPDILKGAELKWLLWDKAFLNNGAGEEG